MTRGRLYNRPFLRCLHGYGLCLWRLGKFAETQRFERTLSLNRGVSFRWEDMRTGRSWEEMQKREGSRKRRGSSPPPAPPQLRKWTRSASPTRVVPYNGYLFWNIIKQPGREKDPVAALELAWGRYESRAKRIMAAGLSDESKAKVLGVARKHATALEGLQTQVG